MNSVVYGINLLLISALAFYMWRHASLLLKRFFWPALLIKLLAGISLGLLYTYYYAQNDTFLFSEDAKILTRTARTHVAEYVHFLWSGDETSSFIAQGFRTVDPRALFFVKGLSLVHLLTNDNYWISSLWFSFLSFAGCWYLFVRLNGLFQNMLWPSALSLFFFPSFVFWGSGIIKESVAIAALCFIIGLFIKGIHKVKPALSEGAVAIIAIYLLWNLKYYWAAVLIPTLITSLVMMYIVEKRIVFKRSLAEAGIWLLFFLILCIGVSFVHPNFNLDRLLLGIVENHNLFVHASTPAGAIQFHQLTADWGSMLINAPWALLSGLFRPFVFESHHVLQFLAGIENAVLLVFFLLSFARFRAAWQSPLRLVFYSAVVYVVLLCIFLAFSTPNFGTLSRYRIGFLPVFCLLVFYESPLWSRWLTARK